MDVPSTLTPAATTRRRPASVFSRVIVGVDGGEPGYEACRQAARLVEPDGWLEIFSAVYIPGATLAGRPPSVIDAELEHEAGDAVAKAFELTGPRAVKRLVNGPPAYSLIEEALSQDATLVAVGTEGRSRLSEIVIGGVTGQVLHDAPCSVLVARPPLAEGPFPWAIAVGNDGSPQSSRALHVAQDLARRFHARLRVLTALEHPVDELVAAGWEADLLVLGSRGLHGLRALGSVSERVAHRAPCSVLVVR